MPKVSDGQRILRLTIDFTYDVEAMYGSDPEGFEWFHEQVLKNGLTLWSDEIGDWIGEVRIVEVTDAD